MAKVTAVSCSKVGVQPGMRGLSKLTSRIIIKFCAYILNFMLVRENLMHASMKYWNCRPSNMVYIYNYVYKYCK